MRTEMRALPTLALAALLLAGCGQKGPLYLPADRATNDAAVSPGGETRDDAAPDAPEDES
ncbi:lipoprotein [Halomonas sp. YLGW01]|uniref:LPS translocon maturation chaperone LptM n=1 Tax=Halomonas sp. YLGW01 TaxID=2773308 RepID=UPI001F5B82F8|nr:lipoprotein [Halomonas sp. YLGW01]